MSPLPGVAGARQSVRHERRPAVAVLPPGQAGGAPQRDWLAEWRAVVADPHVWDPYDSRVASVASGVNTRSIGWHETEAEQVARAGAYILAKQRVRSGREPSAAVVARKQQLRRHVAAVPHSELSSEGGEAIDGEGKGRPGGLLCWDRGEAVLPPPLLLIHAAFAVCEHLALNGMPSEQDLTRSVDLAEILRTGSDDRGSVTERLRKWACAWAITLGARVWRMGNSSKLVLTGMRGTPLAVIDLDPSSDGDEEQAVLSTYMQAWWSDPDVVPEMIDTEMATLLVSFKGSKLNVVGGAWLEEPCIAKLGEASTSLPHLPDDGSHVATARLICAASAAMKVLREREVPKDFAPAACGGVEAFADFQPWFTKSDNRFSSVLSREGEDHLSRYNSYSAVFNGEQALVQLMYVNQEPPVNHAAWAAAGVGPPLLASERVHAVSAEYVRIRLRIGEVKYATNVHMIVMSDCSAAAGESSSRE